MSNPTIVPFHHNQLFNAPPPPFGAFGDNMNQPSTPDQHQPRDMLRQQSATQHHPYASVVPQQRWEGPPGAIDDTNRGPGMTLPPIVQNHQPRSEWDDAARTGQPPYSEWAQQHFPNQSMCIYVAKVLSPLLSSYPRRICSWTTAISPTTATICQFFLRC